jgi:hypothetical protein
MHGNEDSQEQVPTSSWNYRAIQFTAEGETRCAIHEVYYSNGVPNATPRIRLSSCGIRVIPSRKEAFGYFDTCKNPWPSPC